MNFSHNTIAVNEIADEAALNSSGSGAVLAREAGVPFQPPLGRDSEIDPFAEWLSLMEVVEMLCPTWPVRDKPMPGSLWKL